MWSRGNNNSNNSSKTIQSHSISDPEENDASGGRLVEPLLRQKNAAGDGPVESASCCDATQQRLPGDRATLLLGNEEQQEQQQDAARILAVEQATAPINSNSNDFYRLESRSLLLNTTANSNNISATTTAEQQQEFSTATSPSPLHLLRTAPSIGPNNSFPDEENHSPNNRDDSYYSYGGGQVQPAKFRDASAAIAFGIHLIIMMYLAVVWGIPAMKEKFADDIFNDHGGRHALHRALLYLIVVATTVSLSLSLGALLLFLHAAQTLIRMTLILTITGNVFLLLAAACLLWKQQQPQSSVMVFLSLVLLFAYSVCLARTVWKRIPFCAANLMTAVTAIQTNGGILLVSAIMSLARMLWFCVWILAVIGVYAMDEQRGVLLVVGPPAAPVGVGVGVTDNNHGSSTSSSHNPSALTAVLLFLSLYWTLQVGNVLLRVTVSGVVGTWWFAPHEADRCCSTAISDSLLRSCTYSLGSVCLGSFFMTIFHLIRLFSCALGGGTNCYNTSSPGSDTHPGAHHRHDDSQQPYDEIPQEQGIDTQDESLPLSQQPQQQSTTPNAATVPLLHPFLQSPNRRGGDIFFCLAECFSDCWERIFSYFNKWAYCYIGLYGYDYWTAGKRVFQLFYSRGWTTIVNDTLVRRTLSLVSVTIGVLTGCAGLVFAKLHPYYVSDFVEAYNQEYRVHVDGPHQRAWAYLLAFCFPFFIGSAIVCSIWMAVLAAAVDTVIVCLAEASTEMERHHPVLYAKLVDAWREVYPNEFGL